MPQRARTFQVNCCLKVHNAHLKLLDIANFGISTIGNHMPKYEFKFQKDGDDVHNTQLFPCNGFGK